LNIYPFHIKKHFKTICYTSIIVLRNFLKLSETNIYILFKLYIWNRVEHERK